MLTKFMAADHYAYRCMKIPGLNGAIITVRDDLQAGHDSQEKALAMVGQLPQRDLEPLPKNACKKATLQPGGSTKVVPFSKDDPSKVVHLGASLNPK